MHDNYEYRPTNVGYDEYVVQKGDTLYTIAKKYGITTNEIIDFNNSNNRFTFKIKASKANVIKTSNLFTLSYQIKSEQTEQDLLQQEINRINNLPLHLANNSFSQQEIDQINDSNFADNLSN